MKRNPFYDNARLLLIFLVVFGHMIQPFKDGSTEVNTLYMWIYTFHMPAFILLAGFFAKGYGNKDYILNLAKKLLLPYVIFQIIYTVFYYLIGKDGWYQGILSPQWSLWFLVSLFCWHILLIWFKKIPPAAGITIAVTLGLVVGYVDEIGHTLSISRTFFFFPFFLIGYWLTDQQVMLVKKRSIKVASIVIMLMLALILYVVPDFSVYWLLGSKPYSELGPSTYDGAARLLVYITGTLMVISILAWVPKKQYALTYIGSRTLYVYLLHGFFIQFFRVNNMFEVDGVLDMIGLLALSAAIVLLLSSKWMLAIWQPIMEGRATIFKQSFRRRNPEAES